MSKTIVYIDGLNLYYQALKWSAHKWLNLEALASAVLPAHCNVIRINYYYAAVSGRVDPEAPGRQQAYLRALKSTPIVSGHRGNFFSSEIWTGIIHPFEFRPIPLLSLHWPRPIVGLVRKTEEKGSDVNLGAHLVRDAFQGKFDIAAVLTNDTDLKEPIRIVAEELGLPVILLTPANNPARSLRQLASDVRHVRPYVGPAQFPNPVFLPGGKQVHRPRSWATAAAPRKKRKIKTLDLVLNFRKSICLVSITAATISTFFLLDEPWYVAGPISVFVSIMTMVFFAGAIGGCRRFRGY